MEAVVQKTGNATKVGPGPVGAGSDDDHCLFWPVHDGEQAGVDSSRPFVLVLAVSVTKIEERA